MDYSGILAPFKVTMKDHRGGILTSRTLVKLFFFFFAWIERHMV